MNPQERAELLERFRNELVGLDVQVPVLSGEQRRYVNLDNASSTPTFRPVLEKVNEFLEYYSNVHRGTGFKSQMASEVFDEARRTVARFVKADLEHDTVIFTRNTTEALNKLSRLYPFRPDGVVLTTLMEHSSNELPWRRVARVDHIAIHPDGSLDLEDCEAKLKKHKGKVDMVAVTGAANATGWVNPIHKLARLAHEAGARIAIDAAQLAAHRPIDARPKDDPEHLDFIAFSAHKMYAPYGVGVLVGDRSALTRDEPEIVGGGTVDLMTEDSVLWRGLPDREEAGTPDTVGVVALATTIKLLESIGWEAITEHEDALASYALDRMAKIPGLRIFGKKESGHSTTRPLDHSISSRLGVLSFNVADLPHALVAAILSCEGAIGVRNGCFCAHPYVLCMLGFSRKQADDLMEDLRNKDRSHAPGLVRASIGAYNSKEDIDALADCLEMVAGGKYLGKYSFNRRTGAYTPEGNFSFNLNQRFSLTPRIP